MRRSLASNQPKDAGKDEKLEKLMHKTIDAVTKDLANFHLNKAVARWVFWTRMIDDAGDGRPSYLWRVEDGEAGVLAWLQQWGLVSEDVDPATLYANRRHNPHRQDVTAEASWDDIAAELRAPLLEMMERYKYQWHE
jgi:hypothetical protein